MIYCTILTGSDRKPAETFIEATSRFVCLKDLSDAFLAVSVDRTAFMQVKIEEEVVLGVEVTPEAQHIELLPLLTPKPKRTVRRGIPSLPGLSFLRDHDAEQGPAKLFTVMFRDGGPDDRIVATWQFHLVDPKVFESKYSSHFELVEGVRQPAVFTRDARSVETAKNCWNCETPVKPGDVCKNCGCAQDGHCDSDTE